MSFYHNTKTKQSINLLQIYDGEIYMTVPRFLPGVPSTLNKVVDVDGVPTLQPYPSWEMQEPGKKSIGLTQI